MQHGAPVLEQHHLRLAKQLLETEVQAEEKAECEASAEKTQYGSSEGILHGLALSEREELASNVEHAILGTDMSKHNLHVAEVEKWSEHQPTTHELIGAVVHAADLGGVGMVEGAAHLFSQVLFGSFCGWVCRLWRLTLSMLGPGHPPRVSHAVCTRKPPCIPRRRLLIFPARARARATSAPHPASRSSSRVHPPCHRVPLFPVRHVPSHRRAGSESQARLQGVAPHEGFANLQNVSAQVAAPASASSFCRRN